MRVSTTVCDACGVTAGTTDGGPARDWYDVQVHRDTGGLGTGAPLDHEVNLCDSCGAVLLMKLMGSHEVIEPKEEE